MKKTLSASLVILIFAFGVQNSLLWAENKYGPGKAKASPSAENREIENYVQTLKSKRDDEIAALVKLRNENLQGLINQLNQLLQQGTIQIKHDQEAIQQGIRLHKDMSQAKALLQKEEQILQQKIVLVRQQIDKINALYEKQINTLIQAYGQKFSALQQQLNSTQHQ